MKKTYHFQSESSLDEIFQALESGAEAIDFETKDTTQAATLRTIKESLQKRAAAESWTRHIRRASSPR